MNTSDQVIPNRTRCDAAILAALSDLGGRGERPQIVERAHELGTFSDAERATPSPPSKQNYPSYLAYSLSWSLTNLKKSGLVENPRRNFWTLASREPAS